MIRRIGGIDPRAHGGENSAIVASAYSLPNSPRMHRPARCRRNCFNAVFSETRTRLRGNCSEATIARRFCDQAANCHPHRARWP